MNTTMPAYYVPHGGGPCFFMDWDPPETWKALERWFRNLATTLPAKPSAILVVSAHWEEKEFTVTASPHPSLIYDYYGFPEHTYRLTYPAAGSLPLARHVETLLAHANITTYLDQNRGLDHGVFIPLKMIYPEADIPVVQLSLKKGLAPAEHIAVGEALAPLRHEGVLILGSGMSYHNLEALLMGSPGIGEVSETFDKWLESVLLEPTKTSRAEKLKRWEEAPYARLAHPREEHLIPLMVCTGASGDSVPQKTYEGESMGAILSAWRFD